MSLGCLLPLTLQPLTALAEVVGADCAPPSLLETRPGKPLPQRRRCLPHAMMLSSDVQASWYHTATLSPPALWRQPWRLAQRRRLLELLGVLLVAVSLCLHHPCLLDRDVSGARGVRRAGLLQCRPVPYERVLVACSHVMERWDLLHEVWVLEAEVEAEVIGM